MKGAESDQVVHKMRWRQALNEMKYQKKNEIGQKLRKKENEHPHHSIPPSDVPPRRIRGFDHKKGERKNKQGRKNGKITQNLFQEMLKGKELVFSLGHWTGLE